MRRTFPVIGARNVPRLSTYLLTLIHKIQRVFRNLPPSRFSFAALNHEDPGFFDILDGLVSAEAVTLYMNDTRITTKAVGGQ